MQEIEKWLVRQARREAKSVALEDALLLNRPWSYGWYRLRYYLLRFAVQTTIFLIEFIFLANFLSNRLLVGALLLRTVTVLLGHCWWGVLELLRERIRELRLTKSKHLVPREIARWLSASLMASVFGLGLTVVVSMCLDFGDASPSRKIAQAYGATLLLGASLNFTTATFHSGAYALQRIYRPLWASVGVDILYFVGMLLLWPFLGEWSLPVMTLGWVLSSQALTLYLTWKTYESYRLTPLRLAPLSDALAVFRNIIGVESLQSGLAALVTRFEAVVIIILLKTLQTEGADQQLATLLYLLVPFIRASHDWAALFYFDFKHLSLEWFRRSRQLFHRLIYRLAWIMGIFLWTLSLGLLWFDDFSGVGWFIILMLPLFMSQSFIAFMQVRAFSERRYLDVITSGVIFLGGTWFLFTLRPPFELSLALVSTMLLGTIAFLHVQPFGILGRPNFFEPVPVTVFLRSILSQCNAFSLGEMHLAKDALHFNTLQLVRRLSRKLGTHGQAALFHERCIVWSCRSEDVGFDIGEWLLVETSGLIERLNQFEVAVGGKQGLMTAFDDGFLSDVIDPVWLMRPSPVDERELQDKFIRTFPNGHFFDPARAQADEANIETTFKRFGILRAALRYAIDLYPSRYGSDHEISSLCRNGEIIGIFSIPRDTSPILKRNWSRELRRLNLQEALCS